MTANPRIPDRLEDDAPSGSTPREAKALEHFAKRFAASRSALVCSIILAVIVAASLAAPLIAPQNPYDLASIDFLDGQLPPGSQSLSGMTYYLGTDNQGRDMLSAILYGLRISLAVGILSAFAAALLGGCLGIYVAYRGGRAEDVVMRLADLQLSFPTVLVALMILSVLGKGIMNVILAIIIVEWATYARLARGATLVERCKEYVEAAVCLALPTRRIVFRHILPNVVPSMIVIATAQIARAITLEATLSFLGLGVPVTEPSLGLLIANGFPFMLSGQYWTSFYPGLALMAVVLTINIIGDRLRELLNPGSTR